MTVESAFKTGPDRMAPVPPTDHDPPRGVSPPDAVPPRQKAAPPPDQTVLLSLSAADVLENVSDAVVALDHDWRILYANREACRINRKPPEEFVGKVHWEEWPAAIGTELERHLRHAMTERVAVHFEHRYVTGPYDVWLEVDVYPAHAGINLFYRDITARKRAEEKLRRSEERYRSLVEATAEIVWTNSPEGEMQGPQPSWGDFTGQSEAEYQGHGWARAVHPEDAQPAVDAWSEAVAARRPFLSEHRVRRHDGVYRHFAIRAVAVLEDDGRVREWVGVHSDVTEQRQAEKAARERTSLLALSADLGRTLTARQTQAEMLHGCAEALVEHLHAAFARIWVLDGAENVLVLRASAGMYTHLDGPHGRVPVGQFKIGLIAQERRPHLTNAVVGDTRVSDQGWARREGMVAFAGHPLVVDDQLIGVVALFARRPLAEATLQALASVADEIAVGIERERTAAQQRTFLRDVLLSVTDGRLRLCQTPEDLPAPLTPFGSPVPLSREGGLRELRHLALDAAKGMAEEDRHDLVTAASEAGMNAVVHAGGGTGQVSVGVDGTVQVRVEDQGGGITMENLPRATLSRGFSTKATLGHGLKMMLETADCLYLLTGPGGTTVVLEMGRDRPLPAWL